MDGDQREQVRAWRRVIQTQMDALGIDLESALAGAPEQLRAHLRTTIDAESLDVRFYRPASTIRQGGPRPWFDECHPEDGYLWRRLRDHLIDEKGWALREVESLDEASNNVLRHLEDPSRKGDHSKPEFRVQGLVLGYVQSGKTANFTSLIAKAADRGYRLIIVLSGIHNSLRSQTQRRLDLELGLVADPRGVGLPEPGQAWWRITSAELNGDFKPGTDAGPLQQGSRGVMVVKKNATVLRRLVTWLEGRVPDDLACLIIDDEADQASINTQAPLDEVDLGSDTGDVPVEKELDPSTINGLIRQLVDRFQRVSYVAYTATPFANVLIDPDSDGDRFGQDLFPQHFIISLPRPSAYVGAERIFGRPALEAEEDDVEGIDVIRLIPDEEVAQLVPRGRAAATWEASITPSLRWALIDWLLATAAKDLRLGSGTSSMLIHTTQRIAQQNHVSEVVSEEMRTLRNTWKYDRETLRPVLLGRWNSDFRPTTAAVNLDLDRPFSALEPLIDGLLARSDAVQILTLNSSSDDLLDYETNKTLKVILVGGNRLSRGLTLEDLTVSFYVRESNNYDTLLQMGRWFGYRADFIDLTRLWTTSELVSRFRHLALVEEDLRDQIQMYERDPELTPRLVAPKIRSHPAMLVTAKNRMGSAELVRQSYAGELLQTVRFRLGNDNWLQGNLQTTRELLSSLGPATAGPRPTDGRPMWQGVPWSYIEAYLKRFRTAQDAMSFDADTAARYIRTQAERHDELVTWTVAVRCATKRDQLLGDVDLGIEDVGSVPAMSRSRLKADNGSIGVLTTSAKRNDLSIGDEAVDLTTDPWTCSMSPSDALPLSASPCRSRTRPTTPRWNTSPVDPAPTPSSAATTRCERGAGHLAAARCPPGLELYRQGASRGGSAVARARPRGTTALAGGARRWDAWVHAASSEGTERGRDRPRRRGLAGDALDRHPLRRPSLQRHLCHGRERHRHGARAIEKHPAHRRGGPACLAMVLGEYSRLVGGGGARFVRRALVPGALDRGRGPASLARAHWSPSRLRRP